MVTIINKDDSDILATGSTEYQDEVFIVAEYEPGEAPVRARFNSTTANMIDAGSPGSPAYCVVHRVYVKVSDGYNQTLDMTKLYNERVQWEIDIIKAIEERS